MLHGAQGFTVYRLADEVVGSDFSLLICKTRFSFYDLERIRPVSWWAPEGEQHSLHPVSWSCDKFLITSYEGALQKKKKYLCIIFFTAGFIRLRLSSVHWDGLQESPKRIRWESAPPGVKPWCPAGNTGYSPVRLGMSCSTVTTQILPQKSQKYNVITCKQTVPCCVPDATFIPNHDTSSCSATVHNFSSWLASNFK